MSLTRKVAYNTIVQIVGKVITTLLSLVLVAALTRYLGVTGYGQYTTMFAYIGFFAVLADFGFFWILVREISHPEVDINKAVSNIFTLRIIIGTLVFGFAFLIGSLIPQYHDIRIGIGITALASFFLTLNSTYVGVFQNKLRMDKAAITDVIGRTVILILTLYFIQQRYGLEAILWATMIGNFLNIAASYYLGRAYVHYRPAFDFSYWKKLLFQALPMGIVIILGMVIFKIDSVMLSLMRTSEDVGIYGPPYKVLEIILLIPAIFMGNVFPVMSGYVHTKDIRLENVLQRAFDFLVILATPLAVGIIFTAAKIIRIVAGQSFVSAHTISPVFGIAATSSFALQILIVAVSFSFLTNMFNFLIIALGKQSRLIWPYIFLTFFNIGMNFILIPKISYIGAAGVTVLTEILSLAVSWYVVKKCMDLKLKLAIVWKVIIASIGMGLALWFFASANIFALFVLGVVSYGVILFIVGGVKKQDLAELFLNK